MNVIRLLALLTGLVLIVVGIAEIFGRVNEQSIASYYTPAILILIGSVLIAGVRKK